MVIAIDISFLLLWITSFINPNGPMKTVEDAKQAYVQVFFIAALMSSCLSPFTGMISDMLNPKIITPAAFFIKGTALISICVIENPTSLLSYFIWCIIFASILLVSVTLDGYFSKNLPKEARGILIACMGGMSMIGKTIALKVGGELYDAYGGSAPFLFIGFCDYFYVIILFFCIITGLFGDIKKK